MSATIRPGQAFTLDSSDILVKEWDWDDFLAEGATIEDYLFTVTALKQRGETVLTWDNDGVLTGGRKIRLRLIATTATSGDEYELACKIVTSETPSQTREESIFVRIRN